MTKTMFRVALVGTLAVPAHPADAQISPEVGAGAGVFARLYVEDVPPALSPIRLEPKLTLEAPADLTRSSYPLYFFVPAGVRTAVGVAVPIGRSGP
jgi:hypothetical protein